MRTPTQSETDQETAFFYTAMADVGLSGLFLFAVIATGSLTIFAEFVRGFVMLFITLTSLWLLFALHRGKLTRYEYGYGKIEQLMWVVVGLALLFGASWILSRVVGLVIGTGYSVSPLGLALAACANAVNLVINFLGWYTMNAAAKGQPKGVMGAELSSRFGMLVGSAVLQITLTLSVLASDPWLVFLLDLTGAVIVIVLTIRRGVGMIRKGLPHLLDAQIDPALRARIVEAIESTAGPETAYRLRTRRSGGTVFAEVGFEEAFGRTGSKRADLVNLIRSRIEEDKQDFVLGISIVNNPA